MSLQRLVGEPKSKVSLALGITLVLSEVKSTAPPPPTLRYSSVKLSFILLNASSTVLHIMGAEFEYIICLDIMFFLRQLQQCQYDLNRNQPEIFL